VNIADGSNKAAIGNDVTTSTGDFNERACGVQSAGYANGMTQTSIIMCFACRRFSILDFSRHLPIMAS